jgi:hypothetical protein
VQRSWFRAGSGAAYEHGYAAFNIELTGEVVALRYRDWRRE